MGSWEQRGEKGINKLEVPGVKIVGIGVLGRLESWEVES